MTKIKIELRVNKIDQNYEKIGDTHNVYFFWKGMSFLDFWDNIKTLVKELKRLTK